MRRGLMEFGSQVGFEDLQEKVRSRHPQWLVWVEGRLQNSLEKKLKTRW